MAHKKYRHTVEVNLSDEQHRHLERVATMAGVPRSRVLRHFIQDSLDKSLGVYDPLPSPAALRTAFAHTMNRED